MTWKPPLLLAAALVAYALLRSAGFYDFTAAEAGGITTLIQLVGDIYAVLLAFLIFVIWGQFTEVEDCVIRECNTLNDILRFSHYLDADTQSNIRRAIASYTSYVLHYEWQALGDGRADPQAEQIFAKLLASVVEAAPRTDPELRMHTRLIDMAQKAAERRAERVSRSLTRIPVTLSTLVKSIAVMLLVLVFVYPFHYWYTGACGFVLVAALLFMADFVMMDTDNPLKGVWNVSPRPFSAIKT
jgi:hypothetical protein